ncbi:MAG TPA: biopolymer transporter ExbD [Phycisphaerae bacterium]|nr:biopolymer transporter ExbD [Phycisphaerae bacterium]
MAKAERREHPPKMQPPMTPMIDCVFQLIIFFMLIPNQQAGEGYLTTNLPSTSGPVAGKQQKDVQRIKIELEVPDNDNKGVNIVLNESQVFGRNFGGLLAALQGLKARGLPEDHPVLISPWMGTRHKWVVRAFDMAVAARFTNIHFAVPYD